MKRIRIGCEIRKVKHSHPKADFIQQLDKSENACPSSFDFVVVFLIYVILWDLQDFLLFQRNYP